MATGVVARSESEDQRARRLPLHQGAAQKAGELAAELVLEPCTCSPTFGLHEPLDGGAVRKEAGCSTGIARVSRGGELHVACIGVSGRSGNPWRE